MSVVTGDRLADLRVAVALLNLPVRLDLDGSTVVVLMPKDLNTGAEVRVLRLVEQYTGDFRRRIV